jgi:PAS domain S-box-containing protein
MHRRALLPFLLAAALGWGVFAAGGLWFVTRLEAQHRRDVGRELGLVAGRAAAGIGARVDQATRAAGAVLAAPIAPGGDPLASLSARFRTLSLSYPEIRSLVYVDAGRRVFTATQGRDLQPAGLPPADVPEVPDLERYLQWEGTAGLHVTRSDRLPNLPGPDNRPRTPALQLVQGVTTPQGHRGTALIPYRLDVVAESLLRPLATPEQRELCLVDPRGAVVFATRGEFRRTLEFVSPARPREPGRPPSAGTRGQAFTAGFRLDDGTRYSGRYAPLTLAGEAWTVVAASREGSVWPGRSGLLVPALLGSLALVLLLCAVAWAAITRTRRQLREIARFRTAVANAGTGIAMFDRDDRYLYVNPSYTALTGATPGEVLGRRLQTRSAAFEEPGLLARVLSQVREGEPWSGQTRLRSGPAKDAPWRDLAFTVSPILEDRQFRGYVVSALDVTSGAQIRRQLEAQTAALAHAKRELEDDIQAREQTEREKERLQRELRRSQTLEAVGQLAGGVAHDFNNILGSIIGCLYVLGQRVGDDPAVTREIGEIQELCKRGGELNRQLLAVGRRDTGPPEPVEASEFFANLGMLLRRTLPPHITLAVDVPDGLPPIRGNRSNLLAAFLNLGLNARDALPDGGELAIRCHLDPDCCQAGCVVVEVVDNGTGIPTEIQDRVFEPFFTTKAAGVGTGLGLTTAHAAVAECGGTVVLDSTPGEGTRFTVQLPVVERRGRSRDGDAPPVRPPAVTAPVLVVEDEAGIARLILSTLEDAGYRGVRAADGKEALARIRDPDQPVGAVTLDLMLPGVSGQEVLRELGRIRPEVPVLLVTARDDLAHTSLGQLPQLRKPFTPEELLAALGTLLAPGEGDAADGPESRLPGTSP